MIDTMKGPARGPFPFLRLRQFWNSRRDHDLPRAADAVDHPLAPDAAIPGPALALEGTAIVVTYSSVTPCFGRRSAYNSGAS